MVKSEDGGGKAGRLFVVLLWCKERVVVEAEEEKVTLK
jgi:hypothetical protein